MAKDPDELIDPHHRRESLRIIEMAVRHGWDVPAEWRQSLPQVAARIAADHKATDRDRLRALQVLQAMARDRVDAAALLDKIERLDSGQPTERNEIREVRITLVDPTEESARDEA